MRGTLLEGQREVARAERLGDCVGAAVEWGPPDPALARTVRTVAVAVLARTLEVLDGRRPRSQLTGAVAEGVLEHVTALLKVGPGSADCAKLHRVHVQFRTVAVAEVFGTIERAGRVRALAGRLERRAARALLPGEAPRRSDDRWVLTEFAIL